MSAIVIHDYDKRWPDEFEVLAASLREALGDAALAVDHIGSTSVPGLAAKNVIDVQVIVAALSDGVRDALMAAGFAHRADVGGDHVPGPPARPADWAKLYFQQRPGDRRAHIHVRVMGAPNQRYALLFRDYLRARPAAARAYAALKRGLAKRFRDDADAYYEVKDPSCDLVWEAAREWDEGGRR